ncbi:MAG: 6-pyruvoyl-tetrahydropterin synthase-related protein [Chloroflexota bacterium]|nr:6-pyruvoyl-tetrahydropterin synthase-related protein [Chloroflexota bacterium]
MSTRQSRGIQRWLEDNATLAYGALLLLLLIPALLPLLGSGFFASDDGRFHVYRTAALADAWRHGIILPRLFPDFGFGYGQAVLNYYSPLSYFPGALLSLLGVSPVAAARLTIASSFVLAALAAFAYLRYLLKAGSKRFGNWPARNAAAGVLAAVVYTYAPYHLADAYLRGALPELAAFIFPPLILWAYTAAFLEDNPWPAMLWGTLAWAGLVLTHNLTALMMALVAGVHLLAMAGWSGRWRRLPGTALSLALAIGITAVYWLPVLVENSSVGLGLGASEGYRNHFLTVVDLLRPALAYFRGATDTLGRLYPLSWFAVALLVTGLGLLLLRAVQRRLPGIWPSTAFHVGLTAFAMFMTTGAALVIWNPLTPVLGHLQYPWRFLLLEAVGLMGIAGALPALLPKVRPVIIVAIMAPIAILVSTAGLQLEPLSMSAADVWFPDRMWREDADAGQVGATWTGEFLPVGVTEQRWALGRSLEGGADGPALQPAPTIDLTELSYDSLTALVSTPGPMKLRLHQFYQPGWQASIGGKPVPLAATGELGLVTLDLPAGNHQVHVSYGGTPARKAGLVVTLLSVVAWAALVWWQARSRRGLLVTSVLVGLAALILTLNSQGIGRKTWTPKPVQATLEDVATLIAADAESMPDLGVAEVTLYWLALRETTVDYTAFVHLLGQHGEVIAQDDGSPVGGFTPTTRWRQGEIIVDRHVIPLPADLPPGTYGLRAGMYQPETLRNLTTDPATSDNRVDLGSIEWLLMTNDQ